MSKYTSGTSDTYSVVTHHPTVPLVAHIPHSSSLIPKDLESSFLCGEEAIREEQRALVDWFTDELFDYVSELGGASIIHQVSRFVCDPERFEDDEQESMSSRGMGALYTHGVNRERIRDDFSPGDREALLNRFYRPHHQAFTDLVKSCLESYGKCLILDCHSYPQHPLPYELYGDERRPEVCIGIDKNHCPESLIDCIRASAKRAGYELFIDSPFKGSIVPLELYGDSRISSYMFEIRRDVYMDEGITKKHAGFEKLKAWLKSTTQELLEILHSK